MRFKIVAQAGLEQNEESSVNTTLSNQGGAESGAVGAPWPADLQLVVDAWGGLSDSAKADILAVIAAEVVQGID
ncbi:hypothetical protein GCM10023155_34600 [Bremerella cremea]